MSLLYAFLADIFIFHETISPLEIVGAIVIFTVTCIVSIYKILTMKKKIAEVSLQLSRLNMTS